LLILLSSGQIWGSGEFFSPVCLLLFPFGCPDRNKSEHVVQKLQTHTHTMHRVQLHRLTQAESSVLPGTCINPSSTHKDMNNTDKSCSFSPAHQGRSSPANTLSEPKHSLDPLTHACLQVPQTLTSLSQSNLLRVLDHSLGSVCPAFSPDLFYFRFWWSLTCWPVQLEGK